MKIQIAAAALPPLIDGIGDYTAGLATQLSRSADVHVLTTCEHPVNPIPGVRISPAFSPGVRRSVRRLTGFVAAERPDWFVLEFNQFSFGRWGLNPFLPAVLRRIRRTWPAMRV